MFRNRLPLLRLAPWKTLDTFEIVYISWKNVIKRVILFSETVLFTSNSLLVYYQNIDGKTSYNLEKMLAEAHYLV